MFFLKKVTIFVCYFCAHKIKLREMNNIEFDPNGMVPDNGNYFGMPCSPDEAALVLISAPWDITVSMRAGSSFAPDAIIEASRNIDLHEPMSPGAWRKGIATLPIDYSIQDLSHRLRSDAERVVKAGEEFGVSILNNMMHERRLRRVNEGSEAVNATIYNEAIKWFAQGKIVGLVGGDQSTAYGVIRAAHRLALRPAREPPRLYTLTQLDYAQRAQRHHAGEEARIGRRARILVSRVGACREG